MNNGKFKTSLCDLLKIEYPIIQAGMGDVAGPELVAAVCNAGGLGILAATMVPPDVLRNNMNPEFCDATVCM
jgi:NAD(P)H-dependent flavin oxidoreductase YrpB (nitropropane dioxygenase family)